MTRASFDTVAEAQRRAQRCLPRSVYHAVSSGAESAWSSNDNLAAFSELGFAPRLAGHAATQDLTTKVMGVELSLPVVISPTGAQSIHPDGEVAVARAAATRGTAIGLGCFASKPVEEVVAANPLTFFQLYWGGSREHILERLERARRAGIAGVILTLDWAFPHGRDSGSSPIPDHLDLQTITRYAPEVVRRPTWLARWAKSRSSPIPVAPNMAVAGQPMPSFFGAYGEFMRTPPPTWDDVRWLREQWDGPFMIKGVIRVDDARRAVDAGATAISVSNHGGLNIDTTPAPLRVLPGIAQAVGSDVEVLLDGGVRRGTDVVKALALGARAVMIGRPYIWGLAVNGQAGVENVLDVLRSGIQSTLRGLARPSIAELQPDDVLMPDGFERASRG